MVAIDQREKAVSVSRMLKPIPRQRKTLINLILATFLAGFAYRLFAGKSLGEALVFGGAEGVLLLGLPALLAASLAWIYERRPFKYYAFIAACAAVLASIGYFIGIATGQVLTGIVVTNALVFVFWFAAAFVGLNLGIKSFPAAFGQAFFNMAFLWFWQKFGVFETGLHIGSIAIAFLQLAIAAGILLLGLWALFYVINAPAKRNFGISTIQAMALFFAQWTTGEKEFEEVLAEMGESVQTNVEGVMFKTKSGKPKALFLSPQVHYGPFGNLGGSEFPTLLSKKISPAIRAPCFVFHSTVIHDFNPVHSSSHALIAKTALEEIARKKETSYASTASFVKEKEGSASVAGFGFRQKAFLTLSRAPESSEDVELSMGIALKNLALREWRDAVIVDRHNSITDGSIFRIGSKEYYEFQDAVGALSPAKESKFKMGVAENTLRDFSIEKGIGQAGLKTAVFEIAGRKYCIVLIDGNNIIPEFRARALLALKDYGFSWADVFSTDTHSVNKLGGVHNPIGKGTDNEKLLREIRKSAGAALEDLQECKAAFFSKRISISVLGGRKQSELTSTINSVVAITRIVAPAILVLSILLVLYLLAFSS
ncbi:TPA: DUF2070 family protein [Candidatus Micrarchaeota archaeon]|nr:DUF2070 family protein [Candidatus Micrarchaeota archaeon]